jgi:hypothetical protein
LVPSKPEVLMKSRSIRTLAVLASAGLILGAFVAGPADAAKKKKKPGCAAFVPPEVAGDAEVVKVTDAATAEAPISIEVESGPGVGLGRDPEGEGANVSHNYVPVQVDSKAAAAGLYNTIHFNPAWDYDLYIDDTTGTEVAHSAGFLTLSSAAGAAGESGVGTENIYGLESSDCTNYVLDIVGATTAGDTITVDLYLGEVQAAE